MELIDKELLLKNEVYQIVGAAMEVLNTLGHGLVERPYERALAIELALRAVPFVSQQRFDVIYKGMNVGEYIPDMVAFSKVIVEMKCIDRITNNELVQVSNYLRITGCQVGVILNFRWPKLDWKRVVL
ncbi:hypothetical protein ABAC460_19245 [Asticcacaulis sp. AC460]|uniref:GxxExxY protein n=1 Tax=Asticcacaulis sp. AC460 TaxID=1282360 RepID=UPI0003C3B102|nr:GxxExxY protein [Asticcacaulis sp. AC460]ESQ87464.1 hypothetical protein ABAC460_19245 [Asticcacaulis sp. AC460]